MLKKLGHPWPSSGLDLSSALVFSNIRPTRISGWCSLFLCRPVRKADLIFPCIFSSWELCDACFFLSIQKLSLNLSVLTVHSCFNVARHLHSSFYSTFWFPNLPGLWACLPVASQEEHRAKHLLSGYFAEEKVLVQEFNLSGARMHVLNQTPQRCSFMAFRHGELETSSAYIMEALQQSIFKKGLPSGQWPCWIFRFIDFGE